MSSIGHIIRVAGVVVDAEFPAGDLPPILNALEIERNGQPALTVEVQEHVGTHTVRTIAMEGTIGLKRGMPVRDTGAAIRVPVGPSTLGRMFNVLGQPIDGRSSLRDAQRRSIHVDSPSLTDQLVAREPLQHSL